MVALGLVAGTFFLSSARAAQAQSVIKPSDPRLRAERVRLATDTIVVIRTGADGKEEVLAKLVRRLDRVAGLDTVFRETQRYLYGTGDIELDTLEVSVRTLELRHIAERSTHTANVLDLRAGRLEGSVTPTDTTREPIDIPAPPVFHDMMLEAFIGVFPLDPGTALSIPTIRPPGVETRTIDVDVSRAPVVLQTADGPVECLVVTRRGRPVTEWIARRDGHVVRMRWATSDGATIWKLPARDTAYRAARER
jgi:hypothetical protein